MEEGGGGGQGGGGMDGWICEGLNHLSTTEPQMNECLGGQGYQRVGCAVLGNQ